MLIFIFLMIFWVISLLMVILSTDMTVDNGVVWLILLYGFMFIMVFPAWYNNYRGNWISYGEGKLIIRRRSKRLENGRPAGKWEVREDVIALEDIQWYGYAPFGVRVEYTGDETPLMQLVQTQLCVCLDNGKKIAFSSTNYTKAQLQELCSYIKEHTGIAMTEKKDPLEGNTAGKILLIVFYWGLLIIAGVCWYIFDFAGKMR